MNCSSSQPATQKSTNRKYLKIGYLAKSHSKARHVFRFVSSMPEWLKKQDPNAGDTYVAEFRSQKETMFRAFAAMGAARQ